MIGIIFKSKKNKIIFHITDFSERRFNNIFLNIIYKIIFKFSLTFSNLVTCPSKKIIEKFSKKIFFIPNSPKLKTNKISKSKKNIILMLIPKIDNGINFKVIMDSIEILKNKKKILSF